MSKQTTSKNTPLIVGAVIVIILIVFIAQSGDESAGPSGAPETGDTTTPEISAPAPSDNAGAPEPELPDTPTAPAPASPTSRADVDDVLADLDAALEGEDYDTGNVTTLFDETSDESLTQPYEI